MKTIEVDLEALTAFLIDEDKYTNMDKMTPEYKSAREKIKVIVKESGLPEMEKYALLTTCLAEIAHEYNNTITHTYDQPAPYGETKPSVQVEPKFKKDEVVRSKSTNKVLKICSNCAEIEKSSCLCVCQDGSVRDFPINDLEPEQPSVQGEPKFKYNINDKVILKGSDKPMLIRQRVGFKDYDNGYQITTLDTRYPQWVKESDLEPYPEPETKDAYEQYQEAKAEEYKNQSKDMEEKSQEYAEIALKAPWPEAKQAFADAYLAGATEALARQWRSGEEIPNQRLCITKSKDFDNRTEIRFCEWDGENFIDLYDDSVIRPSAFLPIPEPPKDESHV